MLTYEDIGALLQKARLEQKHEIETAARALQIRKEHVEQLEQGKFTELESQIYLAGCLRSYSKWLGLDADDMMYRYKNMRAPASLNKLSPSKPTYAFAAEDDQKPGYQRGLLFALLGLIIYALWAWIDGPFKQASLYNRLDALIEPLMLAEDTATKLEKEAPAATTLPETKATSEQTSKPATSHKSNNVLVVANSSLTLTHNGQKHSLNTGDILFFPKEALATLSSNNPKYIDVYSDSPQSTLMGTLEQLQSRIASPQDAIAIE
jgi:cytoskeleton protein RodZ